MSFYRGLFLVVVMLGVAFFSTGAFAAVPLTLTHQGRLLDATDKPVNGFFDITYRVFEAPSGGAPLWTEVHASVPVADGLFSALLGSTVPLSADVFGGGGSGGALAPPRYLEVTVGGATLTPRLALSSVPSALSSSRVTGDIETAPGLIVMGDSLTDNYATFGEKVNQGLHAAGGALASGKTLLTFGCDGTSASQVMEKKGLNAVNVKLARTISSPPSGPLAQDYLDVDSDDDGVMDKSVSSSCDATGARLKVTNLGSSGEDGVELLSLPASSSVAIKTKGTGAANNRSITSTTDPEAATVILSADLDGDGIVDNTSADSVGATGASRRLAVHNLGSSGQDGVSVDLHCSPDSAVESTELRKNGALISADYDRHTPFHNSRISSFFDVFTEMSTEDVCDATGASRRLAVHNLGSSGQDGVEVKWAARPKGGEIKVSASQNSQTLRCSSSADSVAATTLLEADLDGDGLADRSVSSSCDATSARLKVNNIGSSGNDGVELSVLPTTSSVAIKTKGTGAEANRVLAIQSGTAPTGVSSSCTIDDDGDGVPESEISQILTPTTSGVAIKTKGTGANDNRSASLVCAADLDGDGTLDRSVSTTADSTTAGIAIDEPGVQIGMKIVNKGTVKGNITVTNGSAMRVQLDSDGNGFFSSKIGVGKDPIEKIDVEGGAYCDGTNWVNASDRNSKENFTAVDGNELLDQIAQLSITRWNYKGNNQAEHIGPTAQDFKAAFGVGADDKSISTIDPSGIALAAIKALNNKMQELNAKTSQLEDQSREITQLKAELDAIKAMLLKQAATKN
jgi:hypothetical protein